MGRLGSAESTEDFKAMERHKKLPPHVLNLETLSRYFHLPINEVSKELGICVTVLKRISRNCGVHRWPHRKLKSINKKIRHLEATQHQRKDGRYKDDQTVALELAHLYRLRETVFTNPDLAMAEKIDETREMNATAWKTLLPKVEEHAPAPSVSPADNRSESSHRQQQFSFHWSTVGGGKGIVQSSATLLRGMAGMNSVAASVMASSQANQQLQMQQQQQQQHMQQQQQQQQQQQHMQQQQQQQQQQIQQMQQTQQTSQHQMQQQQQHQQQQQKAMQSSANPFGIRDDRSSSMIDTHSFATDTTDHVSEDYSLQRNASNASTASQSVALLAEVAEQMRIQQPQTPSRTNPSPTPSEQTIGGECEESGRTPPIQICNNANDSGNNPFKKAVQSAKDETHWKEFHVTNMPFQQAMTNKEGNSPQPPPRRRSFAMPMDPQLSNSQSPTTTPSPPAPALPSWFADELKKHKHVSVQQERDRATRNRQVTPTG